MANAFGFKTKTDYSDVTAARQRQTAQTALQLKDAMKNVSSTIIEKRIAKKYDDPYSIEAMKERQVSYAGIDPTRSEQARKFVNDTMTQQRLDLDQAYKQRAEERTIAGSKTAAAIDKRDYAFKQEKLQFDQQQKIKDTELRREKHLRNIQKINFDAVNKTITQETANKKLLLAGQKNIRQEFEDVAGDLTPLGMGKSPNYFKALKALKSLPGFQDGSLTNIPVEILEILSPTGTSSGKEASDALFD